MTDIINN